MIILNESTGKVLANNCEMADNFWKRFVGLQGRKELKEGEALLISPCNSIHMFFMKFPIDAVFIGNDGVVVKVIEAIKPWRVSPVVRGAVYVLELPVGSGVKSGDRLSWS